MKFADDDRLLPQGWTSDKEAIEQTRRFWKGRGAALSEDEGREALHNMSSFVELLTRWSTTEEEQDDEEHQ